MATACETVVLGGFRELPPRERALLGWRYVDGYGVTGARGVFACCRRGGNGGGRRRYNDSVAGENSASATAHPKPEIYGCWITWPYQRPRRRRRLPLGSGLSRSALADPLH